MTDTIMAQRDRLIGANDALSKRCMDAAIANAELVDRLRLEERMSDPLRAELRCLRIEIDALRRTLLGRGGTP